MLYCTKKSLLLILSIPCHRHPPGHGIQGQHRCQHTDDGNGRARFRHGIHQDHPAAQGSAHSGKHQHVEHPRLFCAKTVVQRQHDPVYQQDGTHTARQQGQRILVRGRSGAQRDHRYEQSSNYNSRRSVYFEGLRDGFPIGLGYFAVSFSLGIAARNAGLTVTQGLLSSLLCNASAGEYAAFALIASGATYLEVAIITLIANARYLLMSCALAQRFAPGTPFFHRLIIGYDVTDELFGITIARPGYLNPFYTYGAIALAAPAWASGTALGIIAGNLLPLRAVSALSVAGYGMFLAIIIPPARKDKVVAGLVVLSFALSFVCTYLPGISALSDGTRTILLTVAISCAGALLFPIKTQSEEAEQ